MANLSLQSELTRLRKQQAKARQDEVFGGLSRAERAEYDARADRIHDVETELELHTGPAEPGASSDRPCGGPETRVGEKVSNRHPSE